MPTPTVLRIAAGNPSHRPLPQGEVKPREIIPIAPDHLDDIGIAFYERTVGVMTKVNGWLTEAEFAVIGEAANWYSIYRKADQVLREGPDVYVTTFTNSAGEEQRMLKSMPQVKHRRDAWVECLKLLDRLGLSPAARARMVIQKPNAENDDIDP